MSEQDEDIILPYPEPVERPSKTDRKRVHERLKNFAEELVALPAGRLARLELPDDVRRSLTEARRLESRQALKRQLQHLSSTLETVDIPAIRRVLATMDHGAKPKPAAPARPEETLAATLLAGGDEAIFALDEKYARDELQVLRQAVRLAKKQLETKGDRAAALAQISSCLARFN